MKTQSRPKQLNEYRGLGGMNEKEDLTKERMIDKFSDKKGKPCYCRSHDIQEKHAPVV